MKDWPEVMVVDVEKTRCCAILPSVNGSHAEIEIVRCFVAVRLETEIIYISGFGERAAISPRDLAAL